MDSNEAVEVRSSPGRGLGIFATKDLPRGFRVFEEQPMMHFPDERFTDEEIQEVFDHLSMEEQSEFQKLHLGSHIEGQSRITSIFFTNSFGHRSGPMLFLKSSRVNHSCIPNALAAWNSKIERQTIQLTRAVVIGEEITITYCDPRMEFEDRWQTLRTDWNFDCNCEACRPSSTFGFKSNQRRRRMWALWNLLKSYDEGREIATDDSSDHMELILEFIQLQREEGLVHSLGFAYHHAAIYALKHDDITAAREWAEKEIEVAIYCLGYDSPKVDFIGDWIAHNCAAPIEEVCKSN